MKKLLDRGKKIASPFSAQIWKSIKYIYNNQKRLRATILMVISGVLLYAENIIEVFFNLDIPVPNFIVLKNFMYATETAVSAIVIIFASRMKPFDKAYVVPLYAYINVIVGNIILIIDYKIPDIWWYRIFILGLCIPVYWVLIRTIRYYEAKERSEKAKDRLIQNFKAQYKDEE